MKLALIIILGFLTCRIFAQEVTEKEIKSEVNGVTVFIDGAQVIRKKTVELLPGITMLRFVNLSPFIDAKSVQVKADGDVTVLSVNHQLNYLEKSAKQKELTDLEAKLKELDQKIQLENTYLSIIKEELGFLQQNRGIGGTSQNITVTNLKEVSDFYSAKLTALKLKEIERTKNINDLSEQKAAVSNQIKSLTNAKEFPTGEVLVKIESQKATRTALEVSYVVSNASWFPTYDIRAKNINEPVVLVYKANVRQDTKEDWKDIKLRFSSSNPNSTGVAPELKPYFLDYYTLPPVYNRTINTVRGRVIDASSHEPMAGVNVMIQGTTIGTVTDPNGNYNIVIPNSNANLSFSFIGYKAKTVPITSAQIDVALEEESMKLEEVVVLSDLKDADKGYSGTDALQGKVSGLDISGSKKVKIRGISSNPIPFVNVEKQTTVDFEIKTPFSIKSDNKNYTIDMEAYELPATYKYYCVPKVDKDAFLIAYIVDWEKYNLLEGEANIFFENTFVGKTLLNVHGASDTLNISLGRDKNVIISRVKMKDFTTKQFLGSKKEETRAWSISVKNNKSQKIDMQLLDQVPVSTSEEIEVTVQKISGAQQNATTGEVKWEFSLEPGAKKDFELNYSVKYPKYRSLVIE
jgi:conserved hypothetical protein